jgi:hypothetical protein
MVAFSVFDVISSSRNHIIAGFFWTRNAPIHHSPLLIKNIPWGNIAEYQVIKELG